MIPILSVYDDNGNEIPIPAIRGTDGKSAYQSALEGGYEGSAEDFYRDLAGTRSALCFIDVSTGSTYKLYVSNGKLMMELITELQQSTDD